MVKKNLDGSCPDGSYLHAASGRCRKNSSKPCPQGETRDPVTKRCRAKSKAGRKKSPKLGSPKKSPEKIDLTIEYYFNKTKLYGKTPKSYEYRQQLNEKLCKRMIEYTESPNIKAIMDGNGVMSVSGVTDKKDLYSLLELNFEQGFEGYGLYMYTVYGVGSTAPWKRERHIRDDGSDDDY